MAHAAGLLGDRWTLLILREAFYGVRRFDDLQADLNTPRQALADRLARMTSSGLLQRVAYQEPGRRVRHEYQLTAKARALAPALIALMAWGEAEAGLSTPIALKRRGSGSSVRLALIDQDGDTVAPEEIEVHVVGSGES